MEEREEVLEVDTVGGEEAAIRRKVELELAAAGRKASLVSMYICIIILNFKLAFLAKRKHCLFSQSEFVCG